LDFRLWELVGLVRYATCSSREIPVVLPHKHTSVKIMGNSTVTWLYRMVDGRYRCWEDFERFGFVSAGHNDPHSVELREIHTGDDLYVYSNPKGYIAWGIVLAEAVLPREFIVEGPFVHLQDGSPAGEKLPLDKLYTRRSCLRDDQDDPRLAEFVLRVAWRKTLARRKAKRSEGMQTPSLAAELLIDSHTRDFLRHSFGDDERSH